MSRKDFLDLLQSIMFVFLMSAIFPTQAILADAELIVDPTEMTVSTSRNMLLPTGWYMQWSDRVTSYETGREVRACRAGGFSYYEPGPAPQSWPLACKDLEAGLYQFEGCRSFVPWSIAPACDRSLFEIPERRVKDG
jgi:hypothetical protein